jgi:hypothetical protein
MPAYTFDDIMASFLSLHCLQDCIHSTFPPAMREPIGAGSTSSDLDKKVDVVCEGGLWSVKRCYCL